MRQLSVLFSLVMLIGLISCQPKQDRSADIQTLKSYLSKVDSVEQVFLSIDQAKYNTILGETKGNLDRFKMGYKGELVKEQARVLSEYNNVKRLITEFSRHGIIQLETWGDVFQSHFSMSVGLSSEGWRYACSWIPLDVCLSHISCLVHTSFISRLRPVAFSTA